MAKSDKSTPLGEEVLMNELENTEFVFGLYLRAIRKALRISVRELAKEVGKTPTYISDIENRNNKPPEKKLLDKIIVALHIDEYYSPKLKNMLFDLAAKERNEVSCDIKDYIMENKNVIALIRKLKDTPDNVEMVDKLLDDVMMEVM